MGKNYFSLGVSPVVLKYNGIFTHHFSKHKFVNVIKYCQFPSIQKSNVPFEIFIWKWSTRWFITPLEHQMNGPYYFSVPIRVWK